MRATILLMLLATTCQLSTAQTLEETVDPNSPIHDWEVSIVTADSQQPLPGIRVDAQIAVPGKTEKEGRLLLSDEQGQIKIPLHKGQATSLNMRGPGWCYAAGFPIVGELPARFFNGDPPPPNLKKQVTIKLYRGTEFRGRLLLPDGQPAAGVSLNAGVHCGSTPWVSQAYLENMMSVSYSTSDWPNWHARTVTEEDGSFSITVPPAKVRGWLRIGTTRGGWNAIDTARLKETRPAHPLAKYAPFSIDINGSKSSLQVDESSGIAELGDLQLAKGIVFRGRVVDSNNHPLSGIQLYTSSPRGPLAGRKTISQADGTFQFMPMNAGTFTLKPEAQLVNDKGEKISREVQAVFVSQEVNLNEEANPHELTIKALPHVELEFQWIDRRAKKGSVSYYGSFSLTGQVIHPDGSKTWWRGKTVKDKQKGKEILKVKVPKSVTDLHIALHPDQKVTPSYQDENVENATGHVALYDISKPSHRIIYGDEPIRKQSKSKSGNK